MDTPHEETQSLVALAALHGLSHPSTTCRRCHRPLINPVYRGIGMGRICLLRTIREIGLPEPDASVDAPTTDHVPPVPGWDADAVFTRMPRSGEPMFANLPWRIIRHSPTGMEFGYGGSGPADAALNLLSLFIGSERAEPVYQEFKWAFIATMDRQGGIVTASAVRGWLRARGIDAGDDARTP